MCKFLEKLNSMLSLCVMCCRNNCGICCLCFWGFFISHWTGEKHWGVRQLPCGQLILRTIWGSEHDVVWWQWTATTTAEKIDFLLRSLSTCCQKLHSLFLSHSLSTICDVTDLKKTQKNAHSLNYQETQVNKWQNVKRTLWPQATH